MKKLKKHNTTTTVAIFAGAAALMAWTPRLHAQSAVDDLLNKLEQKGILTADEAQQLKSEQQKDTTENVNKALSSKLKMPDWITSYHLYGDFRGRFDERTTPNPAQEDNIRLRYRLRVGLEINMKDNLQVGFRLGSADANGSNGLGGSPVSNNTTLQGNGTKKFIYVDEAYGRWTPIHDDTWTLAATIGKMPNDYPFQVTPMVLDPDYTPEGGAIQTAYKINDNNSLTFAGAGYVLANLGGAQNMSFLYGAQALWNAKWEDHLSSSLGVAALNIVNRDQLTTAGAGVGNSGNSLGAAGTPLYNLNPVVVDASVTYKLDHFPLYRGAFPIKLAGEYMNNPGAPGSGGIAGGQPNGNQGYSVGVTFGHAGKRGTWDIGYRYQSLDANAWFAQIVNDDNLVYSGGFPGGTNIKGHLFTADYALTDSLLFSFTCYVNSMIGNTNPGGASSSALHAMADLMWKF